MNLPSVHKKSVRTRGVLRASAALVAVSTLGLASCGSNLPGLPQEDTKTEQTQTTADLPMKATDSPVATNPDGTVSVGVFASADVKDGNAAEFRSAAFGPVGDGGVKAIGVLNGATLLIAKTGQTKAKSVDLPESCTDIATSGNGVAVSCGSSLIEYSADGQETRKIDAGGTVRTGTFTDQGLAALAKSDDDKTYFYDADGNKTGDDVVSKDLDRSVLVQPNNGPQRVAEIDRTQTSINDVSPSDKAYNAALRIGQGVGQVASGFGNDGVLVASDTRQKQVLIYSMNDVVRLDQSAPTSESPFAVAWDTERQIAWVSTTSDNKLTGFSIRTGVPVAVAKFNTEANIAAVYAADNGDVILVSKNGDVETITSTEVDSEVDKNAEKANTEYSVKKIGGE